MIHLAYLGCCLCPQCYELEAPSSSGFMTVVYLSIVFPPGPGAPYGHPAHGAPPPSQGPPPGRQPYGRPPQVNTTFFSFIKRGKKPPAYCVGALRIWWWWWLSSFFYLSRNWYINYYVFCDWYHLQSSVLTIEIQERKLKAWCIDFSNAFSRYGVKWA